MPAHTAQSRHLPPPSSPLTLVCSVKRMWALGASQSGFASPSPPELLVCRRDTHAVWLHAHRWQRHSGKHLGHLKPTCWGAEGPIKSRPEAGNSLTSAVSLVSPYMQSLLCRCEGHAGAEDHPVWV